MSKLHQNITLKTKSDHAFNLRGSIRLCPVCASREKRKKLYTFLSFDLVECAQCNTIHLSPLPTPAMLSKIYNNNYYKDINQSHGYLNYGENVESISLTYRRRLKFIKPFLEKIEAPKLLEIGAALGFGLLEAREIFGNDILATDISKESITACKKLGFQATQSNAYGICEEIKYKSLDMVYAFDVIEHLPNVPRFVAWLDKVLKPGGVFFVTTPDMGHIINKMLGSRSPSIKIPQHLIYFKTQTLQNALHPSFKLRSHRWDYQYVALSMIISRLAHIMHLPQIKDNYGPTILVPNGMRMYVFQKTV
jgi:2-polyprenyl-3-methyl-5-hydroxy-6-metoxy-1,4-benzoquinol methylase